MEIRKWTLVLCLVVALMLIIIGVGYVEPITEKTIVVIQGSEVTTLDPTLDSFIHHWRITGNIFDHLVVRDNDMKIVPCLAKSWNVIEDGCAMELELRTDVKFQDGTPFTAEDVKYTIMRIQDPELKSLLTIYVSEIVDVDIIDDYHIIIRTKSPYPLLLARLSAIRIVSKPIVESMGNEAFAEHPIGTGPYMLESWTRGEEIVLVANPDYWGGAPEVKRVIFKSISEPFTRVAALLTGDADIIDGLPIYDVQRVGDDPDLEIVSVPSMRVMHVAMDTRIKPFNDKRVRQAINYAVNLDSIIEHILGGYAYPDTNLICSAAFGYNPNIKPYKEDLEKAKGLLAEAGYPDGFKTEFVVAPGRYFAGKEVTEAISGQLRRVGIEADVITMENNAVLGLLTSGKRPPMCFFGWGSSTFDADGTLYYIAGTGQIYSNYSNEDLDQLLGAARTTMDEDIRINLYYKAAELIHEEAPFIFLYQEAGLYGLRKGINWKPRADEMIWFHNVTID